MQKNIFQNKQAHYVQGTNRYVQYTFLKVIQVTTKLKLKERKK